MSRIIRLFNENTSEYKIRVKKKRRQDITGLIIVLGSVLLSAIAIILLLIGV